MDLEQQSMFYGASPAIFEKARILRANMTEPEKILWNQLSTIKIDGIKFRRQHPISHYVANFYCHKARLVIEIDGKNHSQSHQLKDYKLRDDEMKNVGIRVIRFTNEDVMHDLKRVIDSIIANLNKT